MIQMEAKRRIPRKGPDRSSVVHRISKLGSKAFPVGGALIIAKWAFLNGDSIFQGSNFSNFVRIGYTILFTFVMEYVSRYSHCFLWHSQALWWIHGSHHHQYPAIGTKPVYDHGNPYVSPAIELNDAFAVFFATLATGAMWAGSENPSTLAKDCSTGIGLGVTLYGFSYFIGHDIVAHERLGKRVANFFRRAFPYLDECASVHFQYHHKLSKRSDDHDPYGPPYGFWLGPYEVECLKRGEEYAPMPLAVKTVMWASLGIFFAAIIQSFQ